MANPKENTADGGDGGLTQMQRLMWAGQQIDPEAPLYNSAFHFKISTSLDPERFERAFRHLVRQAPILRTTFPTQAGSPVRTILDAPSFRIHHQDFSTDAAPEDSARIWGNDRAQNTQFHLDNLLFESALLRISDESWIWYICLHHLICDAWSVAELFRLQSQIYLDLETSSESSIVAPSPLSSVAARPIQKLASDDANRTNSPLPVFYGRIPSRPSCRSVRLDIARFDTPRAQQFHALTQRRDLRAFSSSMSQMQVSLTLLSAFLSRVTDQREFCIGLPFHNRLTPAAQRALGLFIELHPVIINVSPGDSFRSLYGRVRTVVHEYLNRVTSGRTTDDAPPQFNAILNMITARFGKFADAPSQAEWIDNQACDREHLIRLHVQDFDANGLPSLEIDLNQDTFSPDQRPRVVGHFHRLVDAMITDFDQPIDQVDLLPSTERREQLSTLCSTFSDEPSDLITSGFSTAVAAHPHRVALRAGDQSWTYHELDSRIETIAAHLHAIPVPPGACVAYCLPRSFDAVATMLATLRHGFTFVPLDPSWPVARIQFVITHCQTPLVVTTSDFLDCLPDAPPCLLLDQLPAIYSDKLPRLTPSEDPEAAAYLLYTSGSTGEPKGVEVSRGALAHYINWAAAYYGKESPLAFPLFTPLTFDLTITSIFVPLVSGGEIVVYPDSADGADIALLDVIRENRVDIIKLTPSHLGLLHGRALPDSKVRQLILGGEDLRTEVAQRTFKTFPAGLKIHNEYGPTEATVGCLIHTVTAATLAGENSVPIGRPIDGIKAYVLNESKQLIPSGVPGELYIAGPSLASGYFRQPDLTAQKFVPSPFNPDEKMYQTGDLVRINQPGSLTYLGRLDEQVKIKGARVELGAIAAALEQHSFVKQAAVTTYRLGTTPTDRRHCVKCGLPSDYPDTHFDDKNVCNHCVSFEEYRERAQIYFRPFAEFSAKFERTNQRSLAPPYDCIALLSGGKDSTYMLARLADMGLRVLAFTLDNGYISDEAKANIRRVVDVLGVDHHFGSTEAMNAIFVDSLKRHANVCQGCFKTIYTLSLNLAREQGIPYIVTGLSRGQFFETRLTEDLFREPCATVSEIDQTVLDARKAYHRLDDAVSDHLDVSAARSDAIFQEVEILDFYRYCDVSLGDMLAYLDQRLPWVRPSDTGRSTNCLINDVGIYVHKRNRGHHNYAFPYSWDVRMEHKVRDDALAELDDRIDVENVHRILHEIGYDGDLADPQNSPRLVAYYESDHEIPSDEIRSHLEALLPAYMLPSHGIRVDRIPLTNNGKVDWATLPDPRHERADSGGEYVAPENATETAFASIWSEVLQLNRVGVNDNFFDLGGDSILAIQIIARTTRAGYPLTAAQLFNHQSIRSLAEACDNTPNQASSHRSSNTLTPIQHWALDHNWSEGQFRNQSIEIELPLDVTVPRVRAALHSLIDSHPALRTQVSPTARIARVRPSPAPDQVPLLEADESDRAKCESKLHQLLALGNETQVGAVLTSLKNSRPRLLIIANHFSVDPDSWQYLLDHFSTLITSSSKPRDNTQLQPPQPDQWSIALEDAANSPRFESQFPEWKSILQSPPALPISAISEPYPISDQRQYSADLSAPLINQLERELPGTRYRADELLIAALVLTLHSESSNRNIRLFVERDIRELGDSQLDFSQTIGCFTSLSPLVVERTDQLDSVQLLDAVKSGLRHQSDQGIGFGILRHLHPDSSVRESLKSGPHEVIFRFNDKLSDRPSTNLPVTRSLQLHQSPLSNQPSVLAVMVSFEGSPRITWTYCQRRLTAKIIETFDQQFSQHFSTLVDFALGESGQKPKAADFPMAGMDDDEFDRLGSLLK